MRQLETGKPIGIPVQIRLMGDDIPTLRAEAERLKAVFRKVPFALRIRDDWGVDSLQTVFTLDQDRAAAAGSHGPGPGGKHSGRSGRLSGDHVP